MFAIKTIKHQLPSLFQELIQTEYMYFHFSQNCEEVLIKNNLQKYFGFKHTGFFVDLGAFHPVVFSNTYSLYLMGWRGINVDAEAKNIQAFNTCRQQDRNIHCGVSDKNETLLFTQVGNIPGCGTGASSSFCPEHIEMMKKRGGKTFSKQEVQCKHVNDLLHEVLPKNQQIDYMNIDLEGFDERVVMAMDWRKYKPLLLTVEIHAETLYEISQHPITKKLEAEGMIAVDKAGSTIFFVDTARAKEQV